MKKIALIFTSLTLGMLFSGCALSIEAIYRNINYNENQNKICEIFSDIDFAFIANDGTINDSAYKTLIVNGATKKTLNNVKFKDITKSTTYDSTIIDYKNGIVSWQDGKKTHKFNCPKLQVLNTAKEPKSFAVNGGGFNDFEVKVTKEAHITQLVKDGEVIKKDIIIPSYKLEKLSVVKYKDYIYRADSPYIKTMRNAYAKIEQTFRNNLPCFEMNRKRYCDSDLVKVLGGNVMLRVIESGYGTVNYKIYFYNGEQPTAEVSYEFYNYFRMEPPEVIGNHDLKKDEVPSARDLRLIDIRTFKEW